MICQICRQPIEVIVKCYAKEPFIDGRNYDEICFTCATIPITWKYDNNNNIIWYGSIDPSRLASVKYMMSEGWTEEEARTSIRAIKKLLKNPKISVVPDVGVNIFECLFLENHKIDMI